MGAEIQLRFSRSQDARTRYYYVYRKQTKGVRRTSARIMKVDHPPLPNPIAVNQEELLRLTPRSYQVAHMFLLHTDTSVVYQNGQPTELPYRIEAKKGIVQFQQDVPLGDTITMDYTFDGIVVRDTEDKQDNVLEYYGPPAVTTTVPNSPIGLQLTVDGVNGTASLSFDDMSREEVSQSFFYRIESRDESGNYSSLSPEGEAQLHEGISGFHIEYSEDGNVWRFLGFTEGNEYIHTGSPVEPTTVPSITGAFYNATTYDETSALYFSWDTPVTEVEEIYSYYYRVRAKTQSDVLSIPSEPVGHVRIDAPLAKLVICRKVDDGNPSVYGDASNPVIAELPDYNHNTFIDTVQNGARYVYSFFMVDINNKPSAPSILYAEV